jgi:hypothetical protein
MTIRHRHAETSGVSLDDIAELLMLVRSSQFDEVEIEWGNVKLRVRHIPSNARAQREDH